MNIILHLCVYYVYAVFNGSEQGYTDIPHHQIQSNETEIKLDHNEITELIPHAFSSYSQLRVLNLENNKINAISSSAFSGTELNSLDLSYNNLREIPDLTAVAGTLQYLKTFRNPLTTFPNITMSGPDVTLDIKTSSDMVRDNVHTVCNIGSIFWRGNYLVNVPKFACGTSSFLYNVKLNGIMNEYSDLTGLEQIPKLEILGLANNRFVVFPNFPMPVRQKLKSIEISRNDMEVIPQDVLHGFNLDTIQLSQNQLTAIPSELLIISSHVILQNNPLNDWDHYKWNMMMHKASSLKKLDLDLTMNSLAQMPEIGYSLCNSKRTQNFTLILENIPGPCDCSVQWMADVAQQCHVDVQTDALDCGTELQDLNLTCPESGLVLYGEEDFTHLLYLVESTISLRRNKQIKSIAVLGEQAWVVHSSPKFNMSAPYKILLPGRYATLNEAGISSFLPVATKPYVPILSIIQPSSSKGKIVDDGMKLFDNDPLTCMSVQGVLQLTIASTEPVHQLTILTRNMDCAKPFHVSVSVRRPVNQCQKVEVAQLISHYVMNNSAELSECVYAVPQDDQSIMIKLAAVNEGSVCSVAHGTRT